MSTTDSRYAGSLIAHERARALLPGGVNSPVRACKSVGGTPFFAARARGAWIEDVDGNRYVDYILAYGPHVLGHGHPQVKAAIAAALEDGTAFGAPTERETELAERLRDLVPSLERLRLVNSGTEATMSALRVARGFTGRAKLIKFDGCYHGHADALLVKAGSGALTFGTPDSRGVPEGAARDTLVAPFNDLSAVEALLSANRDEVAAVILEPVVGNMGVVLPEPGFLEGLRTLCTAHGALLVFDEVMTGFRVALGGAQARFGVRPDLTCLGKVIGGGLPVGAYGGRADVMAHVAPDGGVYQAGTLSGNPLAMAAGLAALDVLARPGTFDRIAATTERLCQGLEEAAEQAGVPVTVARCGTMFTVFFARAPEGRLRSLDAIQAHADLPAFRRYFHAMRDRGVNLPPSQYEACFVSLAHDDDAIATTLRAAREAFRELTPR